MENFIVAAGAVAPLMVYLALGLLMKWQYHFTEKDISTFNKLVFGIFLPVNMMNAVYSTSTANMPKPSLVIYAVVALLLFYGLAFLFVVHVEPANKKRGAMIQAMYRSNFILLGVPLVENIYGPEGAAIPMMLTAVVVPVYNILAVFTLETFRGSQFHLGKILAGIAKNPMIWGALVGGLCKLLPFALPNVIVKCTHAIAVSTTPFALIVLGASFTLQGAVREIRDLVLCIVGRLIAAPLLFIGGAVLFLGFRNVDLATLLAMAGTPCAVAGFAMAQQMGSDGELAGNCVIFSSALSCVTMFLWVFVLKTMGLL